MTAERTRVEIGESVLLPLNCRVQRGSPTFPLARGDGTILEHVPEPDPTTRPRRFCLITAEAVPAEVGPFGRLTTTPDAAAWLDGTTVTMSLRDVPLDDAVRTLMALLPVPVEVVRDADYEATRVTVIAHAEPVRSVLARLLHQCLLDGTASGTLLRLVPAAQPDYPAPRIGFPATTHRSVEGGT